jgi:hypothetical protein
LQNYGPRPAFYNPLTTDTPSTAIIAPITWNAFPARIQALFPINSSKWQEWADTGALPNITMELCGGQTIPPQSYGPRGPRGWQDEYCEWSVQRDQSGNITAVMFTCENPEYWLTLWEVEPNAVLQLYRSAVNPNIAMDDLIVHSAGQPVIDPTTSRPIYNPLNKWNLGTQWRSDGGGAMHLTSTPNTLGAEFDLAAAGTMPRALPGQPSAADLICCAKYGQIGRHSDPTIGQSVNAFVNGSNLQGALATLTNPPGLYIQMPDFSAYQTPDGADASQFWSVTRGQRKGAGDPIDRILHATFSVPASKGYTVSDIKINGSNIKFGSQIVETITMALAATVFASGGANQQPVACTIAAVDPALVASALQPWNVFQAYRAAETAAGEAVLSFPILSLPIARGSTMTDIALVLNADAPDGLEVDITGTGVTAKVTGKNTVSGVGVVAMLSLTASSSADLGDRGILVAAPGAPKSSQPAIGLLNVVDSTPTVVAGVTGLRPHFRRGRA